MKYKSGYKYQLAEKDFYESGILIDAPIITMFFAMNCNGRITAYPGYAWDGASGPAIDTKTIMRGSLYHDIGYQIMRDGYLREDIYRQRFDAMLRAICLADGMCAIRAWYVYEAVHRFGGPCASPRYPSVEHIVP
jgi:hypothetical protein